MDALAIESSGLHERGSRCRVILKPCTRSLPGIIAGQGNSRTWINWDTSGMQHLQGHELQMSLRSRDPTGHVEVACTPPACVTGAGATMLAAHLSLIRRVGSKRVALSGAAFWRCSSKCSSHSPFREKTEVSPLMKGYAHFFAGKEFFHGTLLECLETRSGWGRGSSLQVGITNQGRWRGVGILRMILPKRDTVRGFSTSNDFGLSSQLPMWGLIIINFVVYILWQTQERHHMIRNWMVSVDSLIRGRIHTMLTYSISNNRLDNLIEDMLGLYFFGGEIARKYGGPYMLRVYLVGAIAGSVGHVAYCTLLVPWLEGAPYDDFNYTMTPYILGASAPTNALVVIHVLLFPHHIILANYVLPVPGIVFVSAQTRKVLEPHTRGLQGALSGVFLWRRIKRARKR